MPSTDPLPPQAAPEMAPDPEEDDLDDLDDVLDDFSSTAKPTPSAPASASTAPDSSGPGRPAEVAPPVESPGDTATTAAEDDFTKQLQAGMAELLGELESNPEMAKQFEEMMGQFGAVGVAGQDMATSASSTAAIDPAKSTTAKSTTANATEDAFQETIKRTMQRMQQSDSTASAAATTSTGMASEDALFAQMMKELSGGAGLGGAGGSDDFSSMLLGMMEQLTNKDVLYEPMKELDAKFPAWLSEHEAGGAKAGAVGDVDMQRYREQSQLVKEIVGRFERKGYADDVPEDREYIVERMQKMQEAGAPPPELVGDVDLAEKMMGDLDLDAGCPQQ